MKKLAIVFGILLMSFASCKKDETIQPIKEDTTQVIQPVVIKDGRIKFYVNLLPTSPMGGDRYGSGVKIYIDNVYYGKITKIASNPTCGDWYGLTWTSQPGHHKVKAIVDDNTPSIYNYSRIINFEVIENTCSMVNCDQ